LADPRWQISLQATLGNVDVAALYCEKAEVAATTGRVKIGSTHGVTAVTAAGDIHIGQCLSLGCAVDFFLGFSWVFFLFFSQLQFF
jgi:hypothetical protein